jgi:hypothetical protein
VLLLDLLQEPLRGRLDEVHDVFEAFVATIKGARNLGWSARSRTSRSPPTRCVRLVESEGPGPLASRSPSCPSSKNGPKGVEELHIRGHDKGAGG